MMVAAITLLTTVSTAWKPAVRANSSPTKTLHEHARRIRRCDVGEHDETLHKSVVATAGKRHFVTKHGQNVKTSRKTSVDRRCADQLFLELSHPIRV